MNMWFIYWWDYANNCAEEVSRLPLILNNDYKFKSYIESVIDWFKKQHVGIYNII